MAPSPSRVRPGRDRDLPPDAVEEPSWAIPAIVLLIVAILSLGFLGYYFAPNIGDIFGRVPKPSETASEVDIVIGGLRHRIPANYTRYIYARRGGVQDRLELYALLPDFAPYTPARASEFQDNSDNSRVVLFDIETTRDDMSETERFKKVFLKLVTDSDGGRGPHGLRHYAFDPSAAGYRDQELFVREAEDGTMAVFMCVKQAPDILSPSCRREVRLSKEVKLTYRFKRALLGDWRDIDAGIQALVGSFRVADTSQ